MIMLALVDGRPKVLNLHEIISEYLKHQKEVVTRRTIYDKALVKLAFDIANKNNLKAQYKKAVAGGNDAGAIQKACNGVRTLALSIPCRYLHSPIGLISVKDYEDTYNLALELANNICGGKLW